MLTDSSDNPIITRIIYSHAVNSKELLRNLKYLRLLDAMNFKISEESQKHSRLAIFIRKILHTGMCVLLFSYKVRVFKLMLLAEEVVMLVSLTIFSPCKIDLFYLILIKTAIQNKTYCGNKLWFGWNRKMQ